MIAIGRVYQKTDQDGNTYLEVQALGTKLISRNCRKINRFFIVANLEKLTPDDHDWVLCYDRTDPIIKKPSKTPVGKAEDKARRAYYRKINRTEKLKKLAAYDEMVRQKKITEGSHDT